jgi:hypothetical protein
MKPGDPVRLHCPENPRLDGALAEIVALTEWGAHVATSAAGSGRFRALASEMRPVLQPVASNGQTYTGDVCPTCSGSRMVRAGACATCLDCGSSSGCS